MYVAFPPVYKSAHSHTERAFSLARRARFRLRARARTPFAACKACSWMPPHSRVHYLNVYIKCRLHFVYEYIYNLCNGSVLAAEIKYAQTHTYTHTYTHTNHTLCLEDRHSMVATMTDTGTTIYCLMPYIHHYVDSLHKHTRTQTHDEHNNNSARE